MRPLDINVIVEQWARALNIKGHLQAVPGATTMNPCPICQSTLAPCADGACSTCERLVMHLAHWDVSLDAFISEDEDSLFIGHGDTCLVMLDRVHAIRLARYILARLGAPTSTKPRGDDNGKANHKTHR